MLFAEQAEKTILGAMLLEEDSIQAADALEVMDMYLDSHRTILSTIRSLRALSKPVDLVTIVEELSRLSLIEKVGGIAYVSELSSGIPRRLRVDSYVKIVKEKAALRAVIALCNIATARAESGDSSLDILSDLQSGALEYQAISDELKTTHISELVVPAWNEINEQMSFTGEVIGISTGIPVLDAVTTGWRDGELTYVGATPGAGKSAFMLQCMHAAATHNYPVGCISLEMRSGQLIKRLAIMESGIHAGAWRDPRNIAVGDRPHARASMFALGELPIWITDQSGLNPRQISALARKMHSNGARIIFVDFIQIIEETGKDRREAINRVSAALRDTCKALNIPFVVLSQLSRGDKNNPQRPSMQALRESGNLEQDAHNVMLLFRPKENGEWTGEDEIILDKSREGVTGPVHVTFDSKSLTYKGRE